MSEPLKPRIDFDGPLQAEKIPPLKGARAFDTLEADNFAPARLVTGEEEEGDDGPDSWRSPPPVSPSFSPAA